MANSINRRQFLQSLGLLSSSSFLTPPIWSLMKHTFWPSESESVFGKLKIASLESFKKNKIHRFSYPVELGFNAFAFCTGENPLKDPILAFQSCGFNIFAPKKNSKAFTATHNHNSYELYVSNNQLYIDRRKKILLPQLNVQIQSGYVYVNGFSEQESNQITTSAA